MNQLKFDHRNLIVRHEVAAKRKCETQGEAGSGTGVFPVARLFNILYLNVIMIQ